MAHQEKVVGVDQLVLVRGVGPGRGRRVMGAAPRRPQTQRAAQRVQRFR